MSAEERTGWRDQELSARHREWGFNCPAVDLDFLMVEYNAGLPVALVEYKHHRARPVNLNHATYRAINSLADMADLPFLLAYYWPERWCFYVYPVNSRAETIYKTNSLRMLSEQRFVGSLYHLRKLKIQSVVLDKLSSEPFDSNWPLPVVTEARRAA